MNKSLLITLFILIGCSPAFALNQKKGDSFNSASDVHWDEIQMRFKGICICPRPPPVFEEEGEVWEYWEPFLVVGTVSEPYYSPYQGDYMGSASIDELGGKNNSADAANVTNESTFAQAHAWLFPMMYYQPCKHRDYGMWMTENDSMWQNDETSIIITPEAAAFANKVSQMACMTDAFAVNTFNSTVSLMPWCIGSSGSVYPVTGHVDNDNLVQANNTVASRLLFKLNRLFMICDPADNPCGCNYTPVWTKHNYKVHVIRPGDRRPAYPVGKAAKFYDSGLNPAYEGEKGSNDEFLWMFYRKQLCCTCCE